jgi:hypothetical protein
VPSRTNVAALTPSASASRNMVVTAGDFVPRSISEIIEDEMPLHSDPILLALRWSNLPKLTDSGKTTELPLPLKERVQLDVQRQGNRANRLCRRARRCPILGKPLRRYMNPGNLRL